jgi:S1-C subfamily serine protease
MFIRRRVVRGASVSLLAALMAMALTPLLAFAPVAGAQPATHAASADSANIHGVNLASPAVVRIVSEVDGQVVCKTCANDGGDISFPLDGSSYALAFSGSGAFISSDGYVLTADHVVDYTNNDQITLDFFNQAVAEFAQATGTSQSDAQAIFLELVNENLITVPTQVVSQKVFLSTAYTGSLTNPAQVTSYDITRIVANSPVAKQDVAVVKVEAHDMPYLQLAPANSVKVQDSITAVAYPADADTGDFTALLSPTSGGNVNTANSLLTASVNTAQVTGQKTFADGTPVYETSGLANHGSSGGPVIDTQGRVIGVVDAIALSNGQEDTRVVYLIPSDVAAQYVRQAGATTGGAFMTAWTKAITEYDATGPCHFTNAKRDLTNLKNSYPAFGGVTTYLTDAQSKATATECPAPGPNVGLIAGICGGLFVLLIIAAVLIFALTRRGKTAQPAVAAGYGATPNVYGQQLPPGTPGGYAPPASTPGAGAYAPTLPSSGGAAPYAAPPAPTPQPQAYPEPQPPMQQAYGTPAPQPGYPQPQTPTPQPQAYPQQPIQPGYAPQQAPTPQPQPQQPGAAPVARFCANVHAVTDPSAQFCPICGAHIQ